MKNNSDKAWTDLVERARPDSPGARDPGPVLSALARLPVQLRPEESGFLETFAGLFGSRLSFASGGLIILACSVYSVYEGEATFSQLLPWLEFLGRVLGGGA